MRVFCQSILTYFFTRSLSLKREPLQVSFTKTYLSPSVQTPRTRDETRRFIWSDAESYTHQSENRTKEKNDTREKAEAKLEDTENILEKKQSTRKEGTSAFAPLLLLATPSLCFSLSSLERNRSKSATLLANLKR